MRETIIIARNLATAFMPCAFNARKSNLCAQLFHDSKVKLCKLKSTFTKYSATALYVRRIQF